MPIEHPAYAPVVSDLSVLLYDLPGKLVAIDGRDGSGKTTFARFLAWRFNVSVIETDLFMIEGHDPPAYRLDEIRRIIEMRLQKPRPVVVEGIALLKLLDELGYRPDYLVYVKNTTYSGSMTLSRMLAKYEAAYQPAKRANAVIKLDID